MWTLYISHVNALSPKSDSDLESLCAIRSVLAAPDSKCGIFVETSDPSGGHHSISGAKSVTACLRQHPATLLQVEGLP